MRSTAFQSCMTLGGSKHVSMVGKRFSENKSLKNANFRLNEIRSYVFASMVVQSFKTKIKNYDQVCKGLDVSFLKVPSKKVDPLTM